MSKGKILHFSFLIINFSLKGDALEDPSIQFHYLHWDQISQFYFLIFWEENFPEISGSPWESTVFFIYFWYQNSLFSAYHHLISLLNNFIHERIEPIPSLCLYFCRDMSGHFCSIGLFARRVTRDISIVKLTLPESYHSILELLLSLSWKSHDDICRNTKKRITISEILHLRSEIFVWMTAIHFFE